MRLFHNILHVLKQRALLFATPQKRGLEMFLRKYTTQEVAAKTGYHLQSIYNRVNRTGEFHGITPIKNLNGRLQWPKQAIDALLEAEQKAGGAK